MKILVGQIMANIICDNSEYISSSDRENYTKFSDQWNLLSKGYREEIIEGLKEYLLTKTEDVED